MYSQRLMWSCNDTYGVNLCCLTISLAHEMLTSVEQTFCKGISFEGTELWFAVELHFIFGFKDSSDLASCTFFFFLKWLKQTNLPFCFSFLFPVFCSMEKFVFFDECLSAKAERNRLRVVLVCTMWWGRMHTQVAKRGPLLGVSWEESP